MQANALSRTHSARFLCLDRLKLLCVVLNTVVEDLDVVVLDLQHGQIWSCKVHRLPQQKRGIPGKGVLQVPFLLSMNFMGQISLIGDVL